MSYLVISDLHLTDKTPLNKIHFLTDLFNRYSKIIVVGDLFEGYRSSPNAIYYKYLELFQVLDKKKCLFIRGNHDKDFDFPFLKNIEYTSGRYVVKNIYGKRYAFLHGHLHLKSIDVRYYLYLMPRIVTKILLLYYDRIVSNLEPKLETLEKEVSYLKDINLSIFKAFSKESGKFERVIFGHTHYRELNRLYANPGFFGKQHASYLTISKNKGITMYTYKY